MDMQLSILADSMANLLSCDAVCIVLQCDNATLRHPLLTLYLQRCAQKLTYYGTLAYPEILLGERFRALCDVAMHSGSAHVLFNSTEMESSLSGVVFVCPMSMMVAPLELAEGIVGFVLCTDVRPDAFSAGEIHLLQYQLSSLAFKVEHFLYQHLIDPVDFPITSTESSPVPSNQLNKTASSPFERSGQIPENTVPLSSPEAFSFDSASTQPVLPVIPHASLKTMLADSYTARESLSSNLPDLADLCKELLHRVQQCWASPANDGAVHIATGKSKYTIYCAFDATIPIKPVWVEDVQLALLHLLENALLYSPQGGLIEVFIRRRAHLHAISLVPFSPTLTSDRHRSFVYVTVRDHGIGMPVASQSLVLQPFTRLYHPLTYRKAGRGLGLYIARQLVERMHGQLFVKSRFGKGTSITFTLPDEGSARLRAL